MRLKVEGLHFAYNGKEVLKSINLDLSGGRLVGLVGPNGSGKSTLLKLMDRILAPRKGTIFIEGKDMSRMKGREIARMVGYVPQSTAVLFPKTVFDNVLLGRIPHGSWSPSKKDIDIVSRAIVEFGLEEISGRLTSSLSGGQRQKVEIARAVVQEPDILLLDEPTSSLDLANQIEVMEMVKRETEKGKLAVMAVHDLNLALRYCDEFVMLKAGTIVAKGSSEKLSQSVIEDVYDIKAKMIGKGRERVFLPLSRK